MSWARVLQRQRPASLPSSPLLLLPLLPSPPTLASAIRIWHTPHTCRGPIGSSTKGLIGCVRIPPLSSLWHTRQTFRVAVSSTGSSSGCDRMLAPLTLTHPSH
eukprot:8818884-Pyramimonas_sp.AAC.1